MKVDKQTAIISCLVGLIFSGFAVYATQLNYTITSTIIIPENLSVVVTGLAEISPGQYTLRQIEMTAPEITRSFRLTNTGSSDAVLTITQTTPPGIALNITTQIIEEDSNLQTWTHQHTIPRGKTSHVSLKFTHTTTPIGTHPLTLTIEG